MSPAQHQAAMATKLAVWWDAVSLRTKITGVTVLLLTAGLVVAGLGTVAVLRGYLVEQVDTQLTTSFDALNSADGISLSDAETYFQEASPLNPYYLALYDADGTLLTDNYSTRAGLRPEWDGVDLSGVRNQAVITSRSGDHSVRWRLLLTPVVLKDSGESGTLVIGADLTEADETVNRFGAVFLFFALTVVILGGALTRLLATTTFAPLRRLEEQAARFASGDYNQRLDQAPPNTEVGRLTRSLNSMLGQIDRALADRTRTIDQMRRFIGDASHELRTPLVTVRGYAELYRMGAITEPEDVGQAMERIEKEAARMGGLVQDLLELARLDEDRPLQREDVDLIPIAQDAARDAMASAQDRMVSVVALDPESLGLPARAAQPADTPVPGIPLPPGEDTRTTQITLPSLAEAQPAAEVRSAPDARTSPIQLLGRLLNRRRATTGPVAVDAEPVSLPAPPPDLRAIVRGEENKIRQVVANLIANAIRYSPEGSPLELGVGVDASSRRAVIAVVDHGQGVPPEIRDKIFQRFWRADTSRARETGGNGLGLAIVAAIVHAHRGAVDVIDTPGGGATFRVWLPLA